MVKYNVANVLSRVRFSYPAPSFCACSIMDNILGYELSNGGSIPSMRSNVFVEMRIVRLENFSPGASPLCSEINTGLTTFFNSD